MDLGILFGFLGTWVLLMFALFGSGDITMFIDNNSLIMVCGMTATVIFLAFPARNVKQLFKIIKRAVFFNAPSTSKLIEDMVSYAEIARRNGILSLESTTKDIEDPFIVLGIQMAVDGADPELIEQVLTNDLENLAERHDVGKALLDTIGKYAPAFGMIGTLVGLIIMLSNMDDPSAIGPGMAVALLTTMYGAIIANAAALPLADRLALRSAQEVLYRTIIIKGVMSIQSGDNPRIVEQKLRTYLPPSERIEEDADGEAA